MLCQQRESVDSQQHAWAHATKFDGFLLPWHLTSCLNSAFMQSCVMWYLDTRPACDIYINKSLLFWICFYSPSWQRWVGRNDSSSRSGDWEARWCWSRRSSQTWPGPRTLWTPWSPPAQSCPGLSGQMTPRIASVSSPTSYTAQTRQVRIGLT